MRAKFTICQLFFVASVTSVGEKSFAACKDNALRQLECHNILYPKQKIRVPIDLLMYPHMVLIGFNALAEPHWKCGGSLISETWVLTAAHCVEDPTDGPALIMRVGTATFEFDEAEDLVQSRMILEIFTHPGFKPPSKYNDLALMKADEPFILNRDIRIACLNLKELTEKINVTAIGFGTTSAGASAGSQTLMKVDVEVIPNDVCNRSMKVLIKRGILKTGITGDQMCAGDYEHGGKDTCQGDSGGPLQFMPRVVDCIQTFPLHVLVGVTSFGRDCGRKWAPGVYTRVFRYIDWIEKIVWP